MAINELLKDKNDQLDYDKLLNKYDWILQPNQTCVLSPDSDGFLCGLFMSHFLNWKVVGFYDEKISVINKENLDSPIFLDIEIFRHDIRSMGHHMLLVNKRHKPNNWSNFDNCIQPNNIRNYDGKSNFRLKYPLATIHFLICIISYKYKNIKINDSAIPPLFFTDGVFNILFSYPENVLNWLNYLRINEDWNPLKPIFENEKFTVFKLMQEMDSFFRKRDNISIKNERGDRLRISDKDGSPANIENINSGTSCNINDDAKNRIIRFIDLLSDFTKWSYKEDNWTCWEDMKFYKFTKGDFKSENKTITINNFAEFVSKDPLSWALTSGDNIEYTLEEPSKFF